MLAGLAANVMAQPSGRVCGIHSKHRIYLRSSPFICAIDGTCILLQLSYYVYGGETPRNAAHRILQGRFVDSESGGNEQENIEWSKPVRIILFAVGMLPAVIKLYTLGGIPWTKTWCSFYLASFLLIELLLLLAGKEEPDLPLDDLNGPDISKKLVGSKLFGQISLLIHFICMWTVLICNFDVKCFTSFYICLRLYYLCLFLITACVYSLLGGLFKTYDSLAFYSGSISSAVSSLGGNSLLWNSPLKSWSAHFYFITLGTTSASLGLFFPIFEKLFHEILVIINLCAALAYYIMIFDPSGTSDSSWLDLLGG